jgi:transposase
MLSANVEQRVNIKFLTKLGKSATETYNLLTVVYGGLRSLWRVGKTSGTIQNRAKFKAMMIVFFDIRGVIYIDWVPEGQTVNQVYYKNVLTYLRERVRRRRPDMWKNASWVLHHDNAPAHNALSVKRYLAKNNIPVMEHPPYSPDLAPCDFFLFPKIKSALKGTRFESVDAVKAKATQLLKSITQDDLQHCFEQWKIRMERCRDRGGDYIEGDNISTV